MRLPCTLMFLALAVSAHAADSDVVAKGEALIQQAQEKTDILALPSFRMNAIVRIDNFGKQLDGTYSLLWNGPDQWREETTFPGYSEIQVGGKGVVYVKRSTPVLPYRIFQIHQALGFGHGVSRNQLPGDGETIRHVRGKKIGEDQVQCVEIAGTNIKREVCIDLNTGLIHGGVKSELTPIGSKVFPRSISISEKGARVVDIKITELDTNKSQGVGLFDPPKGVSPQQGCMNPLAGQKIKDAFPNYPVEEKLASHEGVVAIYGRIDRSGVPQNLQIVASAAPGLDQSALEAVRKWRYAPATCSGTPVDVETVVAIRYWLQR